MVEMYCFLFDECLTQDLVAVANSYGHDAGHVVYRGLRSASDNVLAKYANQHDMVFVTNNRRDFVKLYREIELHPGLIIIVPSVELALQKQLFAGLLSYLSDGKDLTNRLIDIHIDGTMTMVDWPSPVTK
jgi:predicted nuclease of predicted toxin-antitoxin system